MIKRFLSLALLAIMLLANVAGVVQAQADPESDLPLTQSISGQGLTFAYPEGWIASAPDDDNFGFTFADSQATLDQMAEITEENTPTMRPEQVTIFAYALLKSDLPDGLDLPFIFQAVVSEVGADVEVGESVELAAGEFDALKAPLDGPHNDGWLYLIDTDGAFIVLAGAAGDVPQLERVMDAMAGAMVVDDTTLTRQGGPGDNTSPDAEEALGSLFGWDSEAAPVQPVSDTTASGGVELTQVVNIGVAEYGYPAGWFTAMLDGSPDAVWFSNYPIEIDSFLYDLNYDVPDDLQIVMASVIDESLVVERDTLWDIYGLVMLWSMVPPQVEFAEASRPVMLGSYQAIEASGSYGDYYAVQADGRAILIIAASADSADMDAVRPVGRAIAASVQIAPGAEGILPVIPDWESNIIPLPEHEPGTFDLALTETTGHDDFTISYPAGWFTVMPNLPDNPNYYFASSETAYNATFDQNAPPMAESDVVIAVDLFPADWIREDISLDLTHEIRVVAWLDTRPRACSFDVTLGAYEGRMCYWENRFPHYHYIVQLNDDRFASVVGWGLDLGYIQAATEAFAAALQLGGGVVAAPTTGGANPLGAIQSISKATISRQGGPGDDVPSDAEAALGNLFGGQPQADPAQPAQPSGASDASGTLELAQVINAGDAEYRYPAGWTATLTEEPRQVWFTNYPIDIEAYLNDELGSAPPDLMMISARVLSSEVVYDTDTLWDIYSQVVLWSVLPSFLNFTESAYPVMLGSSPALKSRSEGGTYYTVRASGRVVLLAAFSEHDFAAVQPFAEAIGASIAIAPGAEGVLPMPTSWKSHMIPLPEHAPVAFDLPLTETFGDTTITIAYPSGWFTALPQAEGDPFFYIADSETSYNTMFDPDNIVMTEPTQVTIAVRMIPAEFVRSQASLDLINEVHNVSRIGEAEISMACSYDATLGSYDARFCYASGRYEHYHYTVQIGNQFALVEGWGPDAAYVKAAGAAFAAALQSGGTVSAPTTTGGSNPLGAIQSIGKASISRQEWPASSLETLLGG
ncbi:MAG: hypothetical protein GXY36_19195 [Chloroflexi bacterium]|nr:hypothetical protein [Chloroflexota bacterium]